MRVLQLDVLRAVAILLVLFHHLPPLPEDSNPGVLTVIGVVMDFGWCGVDLFFVLSGFLVSGLLFKEYKSSGQVKIGRFLGRRGFKIYPSFYLFLSGTLVLALVRGKSYSWNQIAGELTFFQNYLGLIWGHTWSLAVEEHFYLLLALAFFVVNRFFPRASIKYPEIGFACIFGVVLVLRLENAFRSPFHLYSHVYPTHLRIDSLLFGVLLAYWFHHRPQMFVRLASNKPMLLLVSLALIAPALFLPLDDIFVYTFGFSLLYLGFGGLLVLFMNSTISTWHGWRWTGRALGYVGSHSYSIYLYHLPISYLCIFAFQKMGILQHTAGFVLLIGVYFSMSIFAGILLTNIVEIPCLRLRNWVFPGDGSNQVLAGMAGKTEAA